MDHRRALAELSDVVTALEDANRAHSGAVFLGSDYYVLRLLWIVEKVLNDGLAKGFFSAFTAWEVVECLRDALPNGAQIIGPWQRSFGSDQGRLRAFLRAALAEGALHDYVAALVWDKKAMQKYERTAFLRREEDECSNNFLIALARVSGGKIRFEITIGPALDNAGYWASVDWSERLMESKMGRTIRMVGGVAPPLTDVVAVVVAEEEERKPLEEENNVALQPIEVPEEPASPSVAMVVPVMERSAKEDDALLMMKQTTRMLLLEADGNRNILYIRSNSVLFLLDLLERIMRDELVVKFFQANNPFSVLHPMCETGPSSSWAKPQLERVLRLPDVETDLGRMRALWLVMLSEKTLNRLFEDLWKSVTLLDTFYPSQTALLRSVDVQDVLHALLELAEGLRFSIDTRRAGLDRPGIMALPTEASPTLQQQVALPQPVPSSVTQPPVTSAAAVVVVPTTTEVVSKAGKKSKKRVTTIESFESPIKEANTVPIVSGFAQGALVTTTTTTASAEATMEVLFETVEIVARGASPSFSSPPPLPPLASASSAPERSNTPPSSPLALLLAVDHQHHHDSSHKNEQEEAATKQEEQYEDEYDSVPRILSESPTVSPWQQTAPAKLQHSDSFQWKDGALVRVAPPGTSSAPISIVIESKPQGPHRYSWQSSGEDRGPSSLKGVSWEADVDAALSSIDAMTDELDSMGGRLESKISSSLSKSVDEGSFAMGSFLAMTDELGSMGARLESRLTLSRSVGESTRSTTAAAAAASSSSSSPPGPAHVVEDMGAAWSPSASSPSSSPTIPVSRGRESLLMSREKLHSSTDFVSEEFGTSSNVPVPTLACPVVRLLARSPLVVEDYSPPSSASVVPLRAPVQILDVRQVMDPSSQSAMVDKEGHVSCSCCFRKVAKKAMRFCYYEGLWFCSRKTCHAEDKFVIPAYVLQRQDYKSRYVCVRAAAHLAAQFELPVVNVLAANSQIYTASAELKKVQALREQLSRLNDYLVSCPKGKVMLGKFQRQHFLSLEMLHIYSMEDLVEIKQSKSFVRDVASQIHALCLHVTKACSHCQTKGSVCEICVSPTSLYSFQIPDVQVCPHCSAILHAKCWNPSTQDCPRCLRLQKNYGSNKKNY